MSSWKKSSKRLPSPRELTREEETAIWSEERAAGIAHGNREFVGVRFDYKTNLFFAALAMYLLIATCLNINGSSVGRFSPQEADPQILFGTSRQIRVDEWALHTPAILSQCNSKIPFSTKNYSLGAYNAPLIMNVPVAHFSTVLRPEYWLFFLTGTERAYAFFWNMKVVVLLGGVFLLLMLLLENDFVLSLFGALWVFFSGYTQWWYSSPQMWPELVGYFAFFTAAFITSLVCRRKAVIVMASLIFVASFFDFAILLYPPHQVPLVYLSACIVFGVLLPRFKSVLSELLTNRFRLMCVIVSLLLTAGLLLLWYADVRQTLEVLANTKYPGQRRAAGGGVSVAQIFNGFLGIFMTEEHCPEIWQNICESSNFLLLFPIPMMFVCWKWLARKKLAALDVGFAVYVTIVIIWLTLGFPEAIARFTLFDRVVETRAFLSLGIASIAWTCFSLHQITRDKTVFSWRFRICFAAIMLVLVLIHSLYFNVVTDNFASAYQIMIVCAFAAASALLFVSRKPWLFAALVLLPNIYVNGLVNPIRVGLQPILGKTLYKGFDQIARQDPDCKWVVYTYGVPQLANLAYAAGVNVFNGLKYVPNLDEMRELSTKSSDIEIYNRYGYIDLQPGNGSEIRFTLSKSQDLYVIAVDPTNGCWNRLGISGFMYYSNEGLRWMKVGR